MFYGVVMNIALWCICVVTIGKGSDEMEQESPPPDDEGPSLNLDYSHDLTFLHPTVTGLCILFMFVVSLCILHYCACL